MPSEIIQIFKFLSPILKAIWPVLKVWWWLPIPFLLYPRAKHLYRFFLMERWDATIKKIILEVKLPKEIIKPIKAMDQVFAGFHAIHDVMTWREKWIEGVFQLKISCELVSNGGEIHFYIRTPEIFRNIIESNIYAQYPEAEISVVGDYTKNVPQDIPNKDWDVWGSDWINSREDVYPLKTYTRFEREAEPKEEKRLDPLAGLLEGMTTIGPGEQVWIQFTAKAVRDEIPWIEKGREIADKIARRPAKPKPKSMFGEMWEILVTGRPGEFPSTPHEATSILITGQPAEVAKKEKKEELFPPEMKLTPGEKEILTGIEEKISKFGYDCNVRFLYLGKREVFLKPRGRFVFGFFKDVSTENMGGLKPWKKTFPKVKSPFFWFLDKRRLYVRQRKLFRNYISRLTPLFPRPGGSFVLNTEELATLYHFPSQLLAPAVPRVEAKKGEAPPGLPIG